MRLNILYEDNHLIVVEKPAGMLTQADKTSEPCLLDEVKKYLKEKYKKSGNVFLGLVHRLDRPVGGIVLLAKTSKGASRLGEQFRKHRVDKIYHAVVLGKLPKKSDTIVSFLKKTRKKNKVAVFNHEVLGSQRAELSYEVVKKSSKYSLVKINLATGRPHQIRAQLASLGCPIVGDIKYGALKPLPDKSIALFANSLNFETATGNQIKNISLKLPGSWDAFWK